MGACLRFLLLGVVAALAGAQDLETCAGPATSSELKAATFGGGDGYNADDRPGVALTRRSRPTPPPENVTVAFHLYDVVKIDATAQQVTVMGYERYAWKDWRLAYDDACAESLTFAGSEASKVWSPSVFITPLIEDLESTDRTHALTVASDGTVSYSTKRQLTFKCAMNFKNMPRDTQRCDIVFRTFRETTDDVAFAGAHISVEDCLIGKGGAITGWSLSNAGAYVTDTDGAEGSPRKMSTFGVGVADGKARAACAVHFDLVREAGFYEKYVIVPIFLFVLVAYVSFYVDRESAPARLGGPLICFLVVVNFSSSVLADFPRADYRIRLLDYMMVSMYFCASAIFEYGLVAILLKIEKRVDAAKLRTLEDRGVVKLDEQTACLDLLLANAAAPLLSPRWIAKQARRLQKGLGRRRSRGGRRRGSKLEKDALAAEFAAATVDAPFTAAIVEAVAAAGGSLGRIVIRDGEMWIQDQHIDVAARFLFIPLYFIVLAAQDSNVLFDLPPP